MLYRVEAPRFVAGFVTKDGKVVKAAPILYKVVMGLAEADAIARCKARRWIVRVIQERA